MSNGPTTVSNGHLHFDFGKEVKITGLGLQGMQNVDGTFVSWVKSALLIVYNSKTGQNEAQSIVGENNWIHYETGKDNLYLKYKYN